tara:strand:- start:453 stop:671 length:219 start_codon:yes stop_codon:yes gene_type:complete
MINPMDDLKGKFVIKNEGKLLEYDRCGDLPDVFDHLIEFSPTPPEPPHSVAEHVEMSKYTQYLQELVSRERK